MSPGDPEPSLSSEPRLVGLARQCIGGLVRRPYPLVVVGCLGLAGASLGLLGSIVLLNRPTGGPYQEITVDRGMAVGEIARLLHENGVVRSPKLLQTFSVLRGTSRRLKAGRHPFHGRMTTWDVLLELEVPRDVTRTVTIPEGLRREQICRELAIALDLPEDRLLALTSDPDVCRKLGVAAESLEGYLFPETYKMSLMQTELDALRTLVSQFHKVFDGGMRSRASQMGMSVHEAVTLASIVEGEAQCDDERPVVSAVYHNRLKRRMRLQADPTIQYALGGGPRRLFYRDYAVDSPYNTYRHGGLPPGPILSPGEASLRSALYPADVDYLYFVARGDGSHVFSRTAAEHDKAKRQTRWSRIRSWRRSSAR